PIRTTLTETTTAVPALREEVRQATAERDARAEAAEQERLKATASNERASAHGLRAKELRDAITQDAKALTAVEEVERLAAALAAYPPTLDADLTSAEQAVANADETRREARER